MTSVCHLDYINALKLTGTTSVELDLNTVIKGFEQEVYKHLGIDERNRI